MITIIRLFFLTLFFGLVACSSPADKTLLDYEQSLCRADSLVHSGTADSILAVRLLTDLHREYNQVKEDSGGKRVRLTPSNGRMKLACGLLAITLFGVVIKLIFLTENVKKDKSHRRYVVSLSENELHLRNNEREVAELEACIDELPLTDEMRDEMRESLVALMNRNNLLHQENDTLRTRLKEYEKRPLPRELVLLKERGERIHSLDEQVQTLTSTLIDRDEVVEHLRCQPKYLTDVQWEHLHQLVDRVYNGFTQRFNTRFPQLTPADLQLCLLVRLRFTNAQIATLIAVSPASVSQQKFRLKKRLMQVDEALFENGETVDMVVWGC